MSATRSAGVGMAGILATANNKAPVMANSKTGRKLIATHARRVVQYCQWRCVEAVVSTACLLVRWLRQPPLHLLGLDLRLLAEGCQRRLSQTHQLHGDVNNL